MTYIAGDVLSDPGAFLPGLAKTLGNLGLRLGAVGRRTEALEPTEEAVEIYRRLAKQNPGRETQQSSHTRWGSCTPG